MPTRKTWGNSRPFAAWRVMSVTASPRSGFSSGSSPLVRASSSRKPWSVGSGDRRT